MSDTDKEEENGNDVEIFHRINRLKIKAGGEKDGGPGQLDPKSVERAKTVIETKATLYSDEIKNVLTSLSESWKKLRGSEKADHEELELFYNYANQVKDLAATFSYPLMQHFGLSLRDFAEVVDLTRKEHHTIIQAHIDAMWAVYHGGIKDHGDENAEELKQVVSKAIEKYS
jgi:hypothetical protein